LLRREEATYSDLQNKKFKSNGEKPRGWGDKTFYQKSMPNFMDGCGRSGNNSNKCKREAGWQGSLMVQALEKWTYDGMDAGPRREN